MSDWRESIARFAADTGRLTDGAYLLVTRRTDGTMIAGTRTYSTRRAAITQAHRIGNATDINVYAVSRHGARHIVWIGMDTFFWRGDIAPAAAETP